LYVLKAKGPALLGRKWLKRLQINLNELSCADVKDRCMLLETNFIDESIITISPLVHKKYFVNYNDVNDNVRCNDELQNLL